ncbi:hypothetical protein D9611_012063 [Ephemerocybe angulata]|uniref:Uncharacterized protein n=1 Tax=Ephemerocybe angulata TaxID=980116 RepID=A0A8H5AT19_9AGAR|nr:hypothetical protein D9611_012063 [Tulosesus angulatus]
MPPKRRGTKAAPPKPAKAARVSVNDRWESDFARTLASRGQTIEDIEVVVRHAEPLAESIKSRNKDLRKRMVIFYAKFKKVTEEQADEILFGVDSPLPNRGFVEFWLESVAVGGGWTDVTTLTVWSAICTERKNSCKIPFSADYKSQVHIFIQTLLCQGLLSIGGYW